MNLSLSYHQLSFHSDSHNLTALITYEGLSPFTHIPFAFAPSAFQKMMHTVLKDLPGVQNYLDDIMYGNSRDIVLSTCWAVLQHLKNMSLLNSEGNLVSQVFHLWKISSLRRTCSPSLNHLTAITESPEPKDMHSLLALTSWFNKFIPQKWLNHCESYLGKKPSSWNKMNWWSKQKLQWSQTKAPDKSSTSMALNHQCSSDPSLGVV